MYVYFEFIQCYNANHWMCVFSLFYKYYYIIIQIVLAIGVVSILRKTSIKQKNMENILRVMIGTNGYKFVMKENFKFVGEICIYSNIFLQNYIRAINNLMMFYYIITTNIEREKYEIVKRSLVDIIDVLKVNENNKTGMEKAMYYLPIFTCGYYIYSNCCEGGRDFPQEIIELYHSLKINKSEEKHLRKTINSFIYKASRYRTSKKDEYICRDIKNQDESINYLAETGYGELLNTVINKH